MNVMDAVLGAGIFDSYRPYRRRNRAFLVANNHHPEEEVMAVESSAEKKIKINNIKTIVNS